MLMLKDVFTHSMSMHDATAGELHNSKDEES